MEFEWDQDKARGNWRKHSVSFEEASTVFGDWLGITVPDPDQSSSEARFITVGMSSRNRLLIVSYTERNARYRIVSARELARNLRKAYEKTRKHN